jgi:hypothetical protein
MHRLWKKVKAGPFTSTIAALVALAVLWLVAAAPHYAGF